MAHRFAPPAFDPAYFQLVRDISGNSFYQDRFTGVLYPAAPPMPMYGSGLLPMGVPYSGGNPYMMEYAVPISGYPAPIISQPHPPNSVLPALRVYDASAPAFEPSVREQKTNISDDSVSLPEPAASSIAQQSSIHADSLVDQITEHAIDALDESVADQVGTELGKQEQLFDDAIEHLTSSIILPETLDGVVAQLVEAVMVEDQKIDQLLDQAFIEILEVEIDDATRAATDWTISKQSGSYIGQWKNDQPHGLGAFTYENAQTLTGHWKNGELDTSQPASLTLLEHGGAVFKGKLVLKKGGNYQPAPRQSVVVQWSDGKCFNGYFNAQGQPESATSFNLANGCQYSGPVNSHYQLQGTNGVLTKIDSPDWCLTGKFHQGRLIEITTLQIDKDTSYQGELDANYQPHGEGILTKRWNGRMLVFKGAFHSGQWQPNQLVTIGKLGSFMGQPGDEAHPNPSSIILSHGSKVEGVSFDVEGIHVTNMVMNRGAAQLTYSGLVDEQGYPSGEGTLGVSWSELLPGRPSEYSMRGRFSGENITTKKQCYTLTTSEDTHALVPIKDFWLIVEAPKEISKEKEKKPELSATQSSSQRVELSKADLVVFSAKAQRVAEATEAMKSQVSFLCLREDPLIRPQVSALRNIYVDTAARINCAPAMEAQQVLELSDGELLPVSQKMPPAVELKLFNQASEQFLLTDIISSTPLTADNFLSTPVALQGYFVPTGLIPVSFPGQFQLAAGQESVVFTYSAVEPLSPIVAMVKEQFTEPFGLVGAPKMEARLHSVGECRVQMKLHGVHHNDFYSIGQLEEIALKTETPSSRLLPEGYGVLTTRSGHIVMGLLSTKKSNGRGLPLLQEGLVIWRDGKTLIIVNNRKTNANWIHGEVEVEIYKALEGKNSGDICQQQVELTVRALIQRIQNKGKRLEITARASCWHDEPCYKGPIIQRTVTGAELNTKALPPDTDTLTLAQRPRSLPPLASDTAQWHRQLHAMTFHPDFSADFLIPGLNRAIGETEIIRGDLRYIGGIKNGIATRGRIIRTLASGEELVVFDGNFNLLGHPMDGFYFQLQSDKSWTSYQGKFEQAAVGVIFTGTVAPNAPKPSAFVGSSKSSRKYVGKMLCISTYTVKSVPIAEYGIDFSELKKVSFFAV